MNAKPVPVPWDVIAVHLRGTKHTMWVARVWWDVLGSDEVNKDTVRNQLGQVCEQYPHTGSLTPLITRPAHVKKRPVSEQVQWLVEQVRYVATHGRARE